MSESKKGKTPVEHEKRRWGIGRILSLVGRRQGKSPKRPAVNVEQNCAGSNRPGSAEIQGVKSREIPSPDNSQEAALDTSTNLDLPEPGPSSTETPPKAPGSPPEKSEGALPLEAKRYNEAVERLETIMRAGNEIDQFPTELLELPRTVADIDGVAKSMSSAIAEFTGRREKLKENKSQLRGMVETWYKASFPMVKTSLNIVSVWARG